MWREVGGDYFRHQGEPIVKTIHYSFILFTTLVM